MASEEERRQFAGVVRTFGSARGGGGGRRSRSHPEGKWSCVAAKLAAELAAEQKGEQMPWHNDSYDGKLPDGFTADQAGQYIKKVGGG